MTDNLLLMNSSFSATRVGSAAGGSYDSASRTMSSADERLVAQAALDAAEEQLQSLCASYAGTFVSVERRGRAVEQALQQLQRTIQQTVETKLVAARRALEQPDDDDDDNNNNNNNNMNRSLSPGESEQQDASAPASVSLAVLSERHRVRRRTLLQHSSLLELLELPSLMDACVRSSLYDEALSIAAFANTLERRHQSGGGGGGASLSNVTTTTTGNHKHAVVTRVIAQIRSRQGDLQRHLLHRLTGTVTMPQCLEVVTALRRLNSIVLEQQQQQHPPPSGSANSGTMVEQWHEAMELRLQIDFLEARDAWLDSSLAAPTTTSTTIIMTTPPPLASSRATNTAVAASSSSSEQLLDTIERYRTRYVEKEARE